LKSRLLFTSALLLAAVLAPMSLGAYASNIALQATTSVSFTLTTTSNYPIVAGGNLQVKFDSIQITTGPPQAYSFGVVAKTFPGLWITRLVWQFGDGAGKEVPYCCRDEVSEVQYHAYSQPGSYTVIVWAFDNAENYGVVLVTVNWVTPVPEYSTYGLPIVASLLVAFLGLAWVRKRSKQ
jgi:hypothetical protein